MTWPKRPGFQCWNKNLLELVVGLKRFSELLDRKGDHAGAQTYAAKAKELGGQIGYRI